MSEERETLFDQWAGRYDKHVHACERFPFAGYEAVLEEVIRQADPRTGHRILDLGIGTGALARRFESLECEVWGVDFSAEMLSRAAANCPSTHLLKADLLAAWPEQLPDPFDGMVSGYVFHEFELAQKRLLIERACRRLVPGGQLIIGDIGFMTVAARSEAHKKWANDWDRDEHYWAWDETRSALSSKEWSLGYTQISECGGVLCVTKNGGQ